MEPILFAWVNLMISAIEVTILGAVLWQLFQLRRHVMAMLRVLRRIDRKTAEPVASTLSP
jgi:cytochrome b